MLGSGCNPVDLQALHIDEDRQGLAVKSFPLCKPTELQSGSRGFVITGARPSRGTPLCSNCCLGLRKGHGHALRGAKASDSRQCWCCRRACTTSVWQTGPGCHVWSASPTLSSSDWTAMGLGAQCQPNGAKGSSSSDMGLGRCCSRVRGEGNKCVMWGGVHRKWGSVGGEKQVPGWAMRKKH